MKQLMKFLYTAIAIALVIAACTKDKGNYSYDIPQDPAITNLDSVYKVLVGDSLKISPVVTAPYKSTFELEWRIGGPNVKEFVDTTPQLRAIFGLGAGEYTGKLTITNLDNGMKYFRTFKVVSQTAFAQGTVVLSSENGVTQLSFIKTDGTVQPRTYAAVNPGEMLPGDPTQLIAAPQAYQPPTKSYWVIGQKGESRGTQIDANNFKKVKTLEENFFEVPEAPIQAYRMFVTPLGVISGVINGRLYDGTTSTWDQSPTYGMFNNGATGDYELSPEIGLDYQGTFGPGAYIAFDKLHKQFVRFNLYGGAQFFGPAYQPKGTAFDPANIDMELLHLERYNGGMCYAYFKDASGAIYELKFNAVFNGPFELNALSKTLFPRPELINANTKWASTSNEFIYMTSGDKLIRYNPVNAEFKDLSVNTGGKPITMIKVIEGESKMVVGIDGTLIYLDISVGKNGVELSRTTGIPGNPIDMAIRLL